MIFAQKNKGILRSEIMIDFKETGISYTLKDKRIFGKLEGTNTFINYSSIGNDKMYVKKQHPSENLTIGMLVIFEIIILFVYRPFIERYRL